jgi:hypothetical protein
MRADRILVAGESAGDGIAAGAALLAIAAGRRSAASCSSVRCSTSTVDTSPRSICETRPLATHSLDHHDSPATWASRALAAVTRSDI